MTAVLRPEETAMSVRLDHANLSVRDVDGMIRFLTAAFPDFRLRGRGPDCAGLRWVHVGNDETYLSLLAATGDARRALRAVRGPARARTTSASRWTTSRRCARGCAAAGYDETTVPNAHPHRRRVYFEDAEGNDWEFVEYRSHDPAAAQRLRDRGRDVSHAEPLDVALDELAAYGPELGERLHQPRADGGRGARGARAAGRRAALARALPAGSCCRGPRRASPSRRPRGATALGRTERTADWMRFMQDELAAAPWRTVLARWVARLAPGFCASATHGVLRVAHAARSLARRETPQRAARARRRARRRGRPSYQTLPAPADAPAASAPRAGRCDRRRPGAAGRRAPLPRLDRVGARGPLRLRRLRPGDRLRSTRMPRPSA